MKNYSISDIENLTGIKAHTIRIWEQRYNLICPKRTDTNIRYYDDQDLCTFLNIATLNENGYKISAISKMDVKEIKHLVNVLKHDHYNINLQVQTLSNAMLRLDEKEFDEIIDDCVNDLGFQDTMETIIFPFMRKVGFMWQVGTINIAHEHFVTHKIEQRLIAETKHLKHIDKKDKKFLLFLPPNETHQVGLLYTQYLLKLTGHHSLYLGQNLPFESLKDASSYYEPDFALTALTIANPNYDTYSLINKIIENIGQTKLIVAGNLLEDIQLPKNKQIIIIHHMRGFKEVIEQQAVFS